jgi:hypothetical protein
VSPADGGVAGGARTPRVPEAPAAPRPAPHAALRARLLELAARLDGSGATEAADELRRCVGSWWSEQLGWTTDVARQLGVHHDINNALVGVRGNVQLLLMGPAAQVPGARERLEVVLRESDRIREAAVRLNAVKSALTALARDGEAESGDARSHAA